MAIPTDRRCSQCGDVKPAAAFASKGTRLHSACKACVKHQRQTDVIPDHMCHYCGQSFAAKRIDRSMGFGFFCSPEHRDANRERHVMYTCAYCLKAFPDWPSRTGKGAFVTCSRRCKESYLAREQLAHFWDHVDQSSGPDACWPWTGGTFRDRKGYGKFCLCGKQYRAHRMAFILVNGPLGEDEQSLHSCDNPPCCNPAHLFKGTNLDNIRDRNAKGRQAKGDFIPYERRARGSRSGVAKLTEITAEQLYRLKGTMSQAEAGKRFGIHQTVVSDLWNHKIWLHIHNTLS